MKATEILGPKAMTFLEWVENQPKFSYTETTDHFAYNVLKEIRQAQQFLSQPFKIEMVVRTEDAKSDWKPVFDGDFTFDLECNFMHKYHEWGYIDMEFVKTVDDFIRECQREGIELFYHKDYEIS